MRRLHLSVGLFLVLVTVLSCSPNSLASYAERVGKYALKTKPYFASIQNAQSVLDRIDQINGDSTILANALRGGDHASVLVTTAKVIDGVEAMIEQDAKLIKNDKTRTKVLGFLTSAEIALGIIVDSFPNTHHAWFLSQEQKKAVETIKKFKARVRCRVVGRGVKKDDGSEYPVGVWAKMEACKKYPDQTVVERRKVN